MVVLLVLVHCINIGAVRMSYCESWVLCVVAGTSNQLYEYIQGSSDAPPLSASVTVTHPWVHCSCCWWWWCWFLTF